MSNAFCIHVRSVSHPVRCERTRRVARTIEAPTRNPDLRHQREWSFWSTTACTGRSRLHSECAARQNGIRTVPLQAQERRGSGPRSRPSTLVGNLHSDCVGVLSFGAFVVQKFNALYREVLHRTVVSVERQLLIESFRIKDGIAGHRCSLPLVGKFTAGEGQPTVRDRIVGDVPFIQSDRLCDRNYCVNVSFVVVGSPREPVASDSPANEVLVELSFDTKPDTHARAITIWLRILFVGFAPYAYVADEPESSRQRLQSRCTFLLILDRGSCSDQRCLYVGQVTVDFSNGILLLIGNGLGSCSFLLGISSSGLGLLDLLKKLLRLLLRFLRGRIAGTNFLPQFLNLTLLSGQRITQRTDILCRDRCLSFGVAFFLWLGRGGC